MSQRREIGERIASLNDIQSIFSAMKAIASVEVHRIEGFIQAQRETWTIADTAIKECLSSYPSLQPSLPTASEVDFDILCVIGTEHGFCGDFNKKLIDRAQTFVNNIKNLTQVILVGTQLKEAWPPSLEYLLAMSGASVADEVSLIINTVLEKISALVSKTLNHSTGLIVLYQKSTHIEICRLLPISNQQKLLSPLPYPVRLNIPPEQLLPSLIDHWIYALLHTAYYESLLIENKKRLEHMDNAIRKLEEKTDYLAKRQNRIRQEEIIADIEIILLSGGSTLY